MKVMSTIRTLQPTSDEEVRRKFLTCLGIESKHVEVPTTTASMHHPRTQNLVVHQEPLKYDRQAEVSSAEKRRKTSGNPDSSKAKRKKRCAFNEKVEVVPIPMRSEYSNRVKQRLWSNAMEIHENAARNTLEFASEGWSWRSVIEDEEMYICSASGELIHPVHYEPNRLVPEQGS